MECGTLLAEVLTIQRGPETQAVALRFTRCIGEGPVLNILVVDADAELSTDAMSRMLEQGGHRVEAARSGEDAMSRIMKKPYDIVILDMFLPDCMGYELIPALRNKAPEIRIISTTALSTREIERKTRLMGITYYMSKPYSFTEISSLIDHIAKQIEKKASHDSMILNQHKGA